MKKEMPAFMKKSAAKGKPMKPCAACKSPAKCKAAGKCAGKK